jgi:4-amino-4-deoxy-L-arabinose transferase-like glycosyltransferase
MSAATGERAAGVARESRLRAKAYSLLRGQTNDAPWVRPALLGLLGATALLYIVGLSASGWGNGFYAAAVQAGTKSWKAFLFGSFDSSNFITVDKPPASLWVMEISARLFGVSSWSILVPQALEGVAAVGLLYLTVRRRFGAAAGLLAGAVFALTPVAVLMFRFNNPDALLTLLLVAAAYALTRSLERGSTRWLLLAASLVGFGFLAKMLQTLLVVPGFAFVYLLAAPTPLRRRLVQLLGAGVAVVVSAGWWVAIVALWPASSRPYIGGSQDNSILNLIFGYNGFGRLTGNETGSVIGGGVGGGAGSWGPTGITRLFGAQMGTQVSWLLPAALLFIVALLWSRRYAARTDGKRAAVLVWGSWLVVTGLVLSYAQGIIHPYYTVVLGPAIGALVGIGATWCWRHRDVVEARLVGAVALAGTAIWAFVLLGRTPAWLPWLRPLVLAAGLAVAVAVVVLPHVLPRVPVVRFALPVAALVAALAVPAAYSLQTASSAHTGAIPSAGPAGASFGFGGRGGRGGFGGRAGFGGGGFGRGAAPGGAPPAGFGAPNGGTPPPGATGGPPATPGGAPPTGGFGRGGGLGGLLEAATPSSALVKALQANAGNYTWIAAAVGANNAAGVQLATGDPIMAIGGFNGTDPSPTLAEFKSYVAAGKIHYFISGGNGGGGGGRSASASAINAWVTQAFSAKTIGGMTVYDLTAKS